MTNWEPRFREAHAHHFKLTGHLCSVTWREAIALGIDDFEHGPVFTDTEFVGNKKPDECARGSQSWTSMNVADPKVQSLIQDLIAHHVAVTSTLPVFEAGLPGRPKLQQRVLDAMSPETANSYLTARARVSDGSPILHCSRRRWSSNWPSRKLVGCCWPDPIPPATAECCPDSAISAKWSCWLKRDSRRLKRSKSATLNGASYLGQQDHIGSIAVGKQADLVLIKGDPSKNIDDIEKVETVFKDGVGYDSQKMVDSVRGQVGIR